MHHSSSGPSAHRGLTLPQRRVCCSRNRHLQQKKKKQSHSIDAGRISATLSRWRRWLTCVAAVGPQLWHLSPLISMWIVRLSTAQLVRMTIWPSNNVKLTLWVKNVKANFSIKWLDGNITHWVNMEVRRKPYCTMSTAIWNRALGVRMGAMKVQRSSLGS